MSGVGESGVVRKASLFFCGGEQVSLKVDTKADLRK